MLSGQHQQYMAFHCTLGCQGNRIKFLKIESEDKREPETLMRIFIFQSLVENNEVIQYKNNTDCSIPRNTSIRRKKSACPPGI